MPWMFQGGEVALEPNIVDDINAKSRACFVGKPNVQTAGTPSQHNRLEIGSELVMFCGNASDTCRMLPPLDFTLRNGLLEQGAAARKECAHKQCDKKKRGRSHGAVADSWSRRCVVNRDKFEG
jgi:hypothetical protein